jgi:membrane protein implicated in regulation of membrane protease activity
MRDWLIWVVVGIALTLAELLSLSLVLIMIGVGALAAAIVAAFGFPVLLQLGVFVVVAGLAVLLVRPVAKAHLLSSGASATNVTALLGKSALVLERVGEHSGLVKIGGEEWTARPFEPDQVIEAGQTVRVMEINGATALVWRKP